MYAVQEETLSLNDATLVPDGSELNMQHMKLITFQK